MSDDPEVTLDHARVPERSEHPGYAVGPEPVSPLPSPASPSGAGYGRAPALALFAGGFLTCLGLVLALLSLNGAIRPLLAGAAAPTPSPSAVSSPSASASGLPSAAATLPPIVRPAVLTPLDLATGHSLGKATARVTVEVWEDYQCPFCRKFTEDVEPRIVATYVETGKIRFVFRDYSFLGQESLWAQVGAKLAEDQGEFWPFHDYLFANQLGENVGSFLPDRLKLVATAVGLDRTTFDRGLEVEAANATLQQLKAADEPDRQKLGIAGTPTLVVQGKVLKGSDWASVQAAIEAALKG